MFTSHANQEKTAAIFNELLTLLNNRQPLKNFLPVRKEQTLESSTGERVRVALELEIVAGSPEKLRLTLFLYVQNGEGRQRLKTESAPGMKLFVQGQLNNLDAFFENIKEFYIGLMY